MNDKTNASFKKNIGYTTVQALTQLQNDIEFVVLEYEDKLEKQRLNKLIKFIL